MNFNLLDTGIKPSLMLQIYENWKCMIQVQRNMDKDVHEKNVFKSLYLNEHLINCLKCFTSGYDEDEEEEENPDFSKDPTYQIDLQVSVHVNNAYE